MTETKFHVSCDGKTHGLFASYDAAEIYVLKQLGWTDGEIENDLAFAKKECRKYGGDLFAPRGGVPSWFITELKISYGAEGTDIIEVSGQPYDDYIESISDETGSAEFEETKARMNRYFLALRQAV